jgi:hypothetical protein
VEAISVSEPIQTVKQGDVIELTLRGERRTAEVMLLTDDGVVLLDLFDGDRPAWARISTLEDVTVYTPDPDGALVAA